MQNIGKGAWVWLAVSRSLWVAAYFEGSPQRKRSRHCFQDCQRGPTLTDERRYPPCTLSLLPTPSPCRHLRLTSTLTRMACRGMSPLCFPPPSRFSFRVLFFISLCRLGCIPTERSARAELRHTRRYLPVAVRALGPAPTSAPARSRGTQTAGQPHTVGHLGPSRVCLGL